MRMAGDRAAALIERSVAPIKLEFLRPVAEARVIVPPLPYEGQPPPTSQNKSKEAAEAGKPPGAFLHNYL